MLTFKKEYSFSAYLFTLLPGAVSASLSFRDRSGENKSGTDSGWLLLDTKTEPAHSGLVDELWFACQFDSSSQKYFYEIRSVDTPSRATNNKQLDLSFNRYVGLYTPNETTPPLWTLVDRNGQAIDMDAEAKKATWFLFGTKIVAPSGQVLKSYGSYANGTYVNEVSGEELLFSIDVQSKGVVPAVFN